MTIKILKSHLARQPFEPFRVLMFSGDGFDVRRRENAILMRSGLIVTRGHGKDDLPETFATLSLAHISSIERLHQRRRKHR